MALDTTLSGRLYHWLKDYDDNGSSGTWTNAVGSVNATRSVADQWPSEQVSDGGQTYPRFDGTNDHLRSGSLTGLPAYNSAHHKIWGCAFRLASAGSGTTRWIYGVDSWNYFVNSSNIINVAGTTTNSAISHDVWHTLIVVWNGTTLRQYLDGVAQTTTSSNGFASTWLSTTEHWYGDRAGGGFPFRGDLLSMFWGSDASTSFTQSDVDAVHDDLIALVEGAPGTEGTLSATLDAATLSSTGTVLVAGTVSSTLDAATATSTATAPVTGALAASLDPATVSAAGTVALTGAVSTTLDAATSSSAGMVRVAADLAQTLDAATVSATGQVPVTGTLAATLDAVTLFSTPTANATLAKTLADATLSAAGTVQDVEFEPSVVSDTSVVLALTRAEDEVLARVTETSVVIVRHIGT